MADSKPLLGEIAKDDHGMFMAQAHIATLLENPDSVLRSRGRDLKIYDELLRDDQVKSTFGQRVDSVVSKETEVIPGGKRSIDKAAADFIREQLDNLGRWDDIYRKMSFGLFYGRAHGECMWRIGSRYVELADIRVRDRSRFGFNANNQLIHMSNRVPQGEVMPDQKFWQFSAGASHDDNPYGLGLAHAVYWPVFFKRNGIKFWLIFLEKFGMPTSVAKLSNAKIDDPVERKKALAVLRSIQSDAGIVVPEDMTIELLEAARSGTADYDGLCERMDKAISKVMVGQTMTTDNGSSMSQAQVHERVAEAIEKADADLICGSFNAGPVRWLTDWNFPGAAYPKVWRKIEPTEDLEALAERDTKIISLGYEPTEEYIKETYGDGWVKSPFGPRLPAQHGMGNGLPGDANQLPGMAGLDSVQKTALNGAQITSLSEVIALVQQGQLDRERAQALIEVGFPDINPEQIQRLLGSGVKKSLALVPKANGLGPMGPEFTELSELARKRIDNRADQDQLVTAAAALATKYDELYGGRIEQLLSYLEESQDIATFQKHLTDMMAEAPPAETVETIRNATFTARLMGLLRGQR